MTSPHDSSSGEKRAEQWSAQERLEALLETQSLSSEGLQAWCRQRGLFAHQLATWKAEFCTPAKPAADAGEVPIPDWVSKFLGMAQEVKRLHDVYVVPPKPGKHTDA